MREDDFSVLEGFYTLHETIGQGGFAKVKKVFLRVVSSFTLLLNNNYYLIITFHLMVSFRLRIFLRERG